MSSVYVLEHVVRYEGSIILGVYGTWDALLHGVTLHYPPAHDGPAETLLTGEHTNPNGRTWTTPDYGISDEERLRVTEHTVRTATAPTFEIHMRWTHDGDQYDEVVRTNDDISDEDQAATLVYTWNKTPPRGTPPNVEFYTTRID